MPWYQHQAPLEAEDQGRIELTARAGVLGLHGAFALPEHPCDGGAESEVVLRIQQRTVSEGAAGVVEVGPVGGPAPMPLFPAARR